MTILLLNEDELRQTINLAEAMQAVESAFIAAAEGRFDIPGSFRLTLAEVGGEVHVKGAYLQDAPYYAVRIGNNFRHNPQINLPAQSGLIAVFDAATGFPAAILLDNGYLSIVRAGVVGGLAAKYLAHPTPEKVAIIGTGRQAFIQAKALMVVSRVKEMHVWGLTPLEVDSFARRLVEDHDVIPVIAPTIEEAVRGADLIITATPSREPLLQAEWLKAGAHITAAGSSSPEQQELHPNVLRRAEVIIADNLEYCATRGEIHHALAAQSITRADIQGELGHLLAGHIPGRTSPGQITLADLTGLDWQDAVIATLALDKALFLGLGQRLEQTNLAERVEGLL
jgi:ornithine cyclodeaminase